MATKKPLKTSLSRAQISLFWRAFSSACHNLGLSTRDETEKYRKNVLLEETGKTSLKQLDRTKDFDAVMHRLSADSGDWETAAKFAAGDDYRVAVMIKICCRQIMQLKGVPEGSDAAADYLRGVLEQSRIVTVDKAGDSSFWLDISRGSALSVFAMLDTHRRRLLAGYGESLNLFKGFDPAVVYQPKPNGGLRLTFNKAYYADFNTIQVNLRAS